MGMKERTLMMKGAYDIDSQSGKGTSLRFSIPLYARQQPIIGSQ
jgi:signal transduction histidine kinase